MRNMLQSMEYQRISAVAAYMSKLYHESSTKIQENLVSATLCKQEQHELEAKEKQQSLSDG